MAESNLTLTLDDEVREKAESLFSEVGLTITTALQKFVNKCVNDGRVPLETIEDENYSDDDELFYSKSNIDEINRRTKELDEGKGIVYTWEEFEAFRDELKAKYQ